ncbi:hypothetical protein Tco_0328878 [Tanacetum coccineum]
MIENVLDAVTRESSILEMSNTTERQVTQRAICRMVLGSDNGDEDDEKVKDETCLVAHASIDLEPNEWIKDSGCSKHITGNRNDTLFSTYKAYNRGNVVFGSNLRGNIIGKGYDFYVHAQN